MSFKEHAARVTEQYTNKSLLKERIAKNYVCNFSAEVSSAQPSMTWRMATARGHVMATVALLEKCRYCSEKMKNHSDSTRVL